MGINGAIPDDSFKEFVLDQLSALPDVLEQPHELTLWARKAIQLAVAYKKRPKRSK
jgi:hypothetical protein